MFSLALSSPAPIPTLVWNFPKNVWCKHIMSWFLSTTDLKNFEFWQTPLAIWHGGLEKGAHFGLFVYPLGITEMRRQEGWRPFGASQYCMVPVGSNESLEEFSRSRPWPGLAPSQRQAWFWDITLFLGLFRPPRKDNFSAGGVLIGCSLSWTFK